MSAVIDIFEGVNAVELNFSPSGISRKVLYPKSAFGFVSYFEFLGENVTQVTAISDNLTPSQITGVAIAETPTVPDTTILRVRNWNGVQLATTDELYEKIKAFING